MRAYFFPMDLFPSQSASGTTLAVADTNPSTDTPLRAHLFGQRRRIRRLPRGLFSLIGAAAIASLGLHTRSMGGETAPKGTKVTVDPWCKRQIDGISELRREAYFGLCDNGTDFDKRCQPEGRYDLIIRENGATFGSMLGVVKGLEQWKHAIREDAKRPGFADLGFLAAKLASLPHSPGEKFLHDLNGRLELVAHESNSAFPEFMGRYLSKTQQKAAKPAWLPQNLKASAELIAAALKYKFSDFDRPSYYELLNEPDWSYFRDQHFADWHLAAQETIHRELPGLKVGGPCLSIAYFYKDQYKAFEGMKTFIDNTRCGLDFYSFHVYDFLRKKETGVGGRITSGLPFEGVLDLVEGYTQLTYGKKVPLVISEHGETGPKELMGQLAAEMKFPEEGFAWEMKKRAIHDFVHVSSVITNTLAFMDHPATVVKAVPFILFEAPWDPNYRSTLYVPNNFKDKSNMIATNVVFFYRLYRDLKGFRVASTCADPDIQVRALVDGTSLFVVLNNLSNLEKRLELTLPESARLVLRRFGPRQDMTPFLDESEPVSLNGLTLKGRETILIKAESKAPFLPARTVNELSFYGDKTRVQAQQPARITVQVPDPKNVRSAQLRIGVSRPSNKGSNLKVVFNGKDLAVPQEGCAERLTDEKGEYASCKLIPLDPATLLKTNEVEVLFPDGNPGAIGAVVIRASYPSGMVTSSSPRDSTRSSKPRKSR